ncbi:hypothetical protein D3C84_1256230 [compost metagenome]
MATGEAAVQRVQLTLVDDAVAPHVGQEHGGRAVFHTRHDDAEVGALGPCDQPFAAVDKVVVTIAGSGGA